MKSDQDATEGELLAGQPEVVEAAPGARPPGYLAGGGEIVGGAGPAALPTRGWPRFVSAFNYGNYRALWTAALVSNIGAWAQNIARDWLVYQLSGPDGRFWLGLNAFAEGVPLVLLLPLGGVLADRVNRRRMLIITNCLSAMVALILAGLTVTGLLRAWHILAMTAALGALDALRIPANQSFLPDLVARPDLPNAIALNSLQFNISRIIGPILGGLSLFYVGAATSFAVNAMSFLAVIGVLWRLKVTPSPVSAQSLREGLFAGFRYVRSRVDLVVMMLLIVLAGVLSTPVTKMLPALSDDVFHRGEAGFSQLLAFFGIGAVLGAILMAIHSRRAASPWRSFPILFVMGVAQTALGLKGVSFPIALGLMMLLGLCFIGTMVRLNTAIIASTPDEFRGRAMAMQVLSFRIGVPIGGLLAGWVAQQAGTAAAFLLFGIAMMVIIPLVMLGVRHKDVTYQHDPGDLTGIGK